MHDPIATLDHDARSWCSVRLGDDPLVPAEARIAGPRSIIAAAFARLMDMRRERARLIYRHTPITSLEKGSPP